MATNKLTRPNSAISDTEESFYRKRHSFLAGCTLNIAKEVLLWSVNSGGDGNYYRWAGNFPKVVPPNSTPNNSGGIGVASWLSVGNANYLDTLTTEIGSLDDRVEILEQSPGGKSAYDSYLDTTTDNPPLTEAQWVASLQGTTGPGLVIKGSLGSTDDLPMIGNIPGDAYIVQEQMWVWDSLAWSPVGQVGPEGKSAYQVWLTQPGNADKTVEQYLNSIKGEKGDRGATGSVGPRGENAAALKFQGTVASLPPATQDNLNWAFSLGTPELYVSNGTTWVNLGSIQGQPGPQGSQGPRGYDGPEGPQGPEGPTGPEGPQGVQGEQGSGLNVKGTLNSQDDLPTTDVNVGDAYLIPTTEDPNLSDVWIYVKSAEGILGWQNFGLLSGPKGEKGDTGAQGLRGPDGPQGQQGIQGNPGAACIPRGTVPTEADLPTTGRIRGDFYVAEDTGIGYGYDGSQFVNLGLIRGPEGQQGEQGPVGETGAKGDVGAGLNILGSVASESALPANPTVGDAYLIDVDLYIYNGTAWVNVGPVRGPQGAQGETGPQGPQGVQGSGIAFIDIISDMSQLPATGNAGDAYLYANSETPVPHLIVWNTSSQSWNDAGTFKGDTGAQGPKGDKGDKGDTGLTGEQGIQGIQGEQGIQGIQGEVGPEGPQGIAGPTGPKGDLGPGVTILGTVNSEADLPTTGNTNGDAYLIGEDFYVWNGTQWQNVGPFRGPQGETGPQGATGATGATGAQGPQGMKGDQGSLWVVLAKAPGPLDGRIGDYYIDSTTNRYYLKTTNTNWAYLGTMGGGNVYDAPSDNTPYVRQNQDWISLPEPDVQEAPIDGTQYLRQDGEWTSYVAPIPAVGEAPTDSLYYSRRNAGWVSFTPFTEAPQDSSLYARRNGAWTAFSAGISEAPTGNTNLYARSNGGWTQFTAGLPDAPINTTTTYGRANGAWTSVTPEPASYVAGAYYVRSDNAWKRFDRYDLNVTATTATLDCSVAQTFTVDLSTAKTLTLTNLPTGRAMAIVIVFTGNTGGVTYTNTINWTDSTPPTYSASKTTICILWDGTSLLGFKPGGY